MTVTDRGRAPDPDLRGHRALLVRERRGGLPHRRRDRVPRTLVGLGHPPTPPTPPDGVSDDPTDTSRFDDPQLDAPQFEATQFDAPGFETRRFAASRSPSGDDVEGHALERGRRGRHRALARSPASCASPPSRTRSASPTLAGTYSYANETPNIVYELLLGGVLTATLVPLFVRHFESHDDDAAARDLHRGDARARSRSPSSASSLAPWIVDLYTLHVDGREPRRRNRSWPPTCCGCSCRRCSSTASSPSRPRCSTPGAASLAAAFAPVLNNVVVIAVFLALPRIADGSLTSTACSTTTGSSCSSGSAPPPASW